MMRKIFKSGGGKNGFFRKCGGRVLVVTVLLAAMLFAGCGEKKQPDSIGDFINASKNFDDYNSLASENGLGNTLVYIYGKVVHEYTQGITDLNNESVDSTILVVEQEEGKQWLVITYSEDEINEVKERDIRAFGTYIGYSEKGGRPGISLKIDSENANFEKGEIQVKEDEDTYKTVWNYYKDYYQPLEEEKKKQAYDEIIKEREYDFGSSGKAKFKLSKNGYEKMSIDVTLTSDELDELGVAVTYLNSPLIKLKDEYSMTITLTAWDNTSEAIFTNVNGVVAGVEKDGEATLQSPMWVTSWMTSATTEEELSRIQSMTDNLGEQILSMTNDFFKDID